MTRNYEIRVEGELGETLLRYLRCPHRTVPEETVLRVDATSAELARLLRACSEHGLTIERVIRISPPLVASPSAVNG
jgi:hypothetical protein